LIIDVIANYTNNVLNKIPNDDNNRKIEMELFDRMFFKTFQLQELVDKIQVIQEE
jgi:hypothetical protein